MSRVIWDVFFPRDNISEVFFRSGDFVMSKVVINVIPDVCFRLLNKSEIDSALNSFSQFKVVPS